MSKFKVGDKFITEIIEVNDNGTCAYKLKNIYGRYSEDRLMQMKKIEMSDEEAWDIAKKIVAPVVKGGFTGIELIDIFEANSMYEVFEKFTPRKTKEKIEAFEKTRQEIKEGNVVKHRDNKKKKIWVTKCSVDTFCGIDFRGNPHKNLNKKEWEQTGLTIGIKSILKKIRH